MDHIILSIPVRMMRFYPEEKLRKKFIDIKGVPGMGTLFLVRPAGRTFLTVREGKPDQVSYALDTGKH